MVYFLQGQPCADNRISAAATVIVICDHITAGFHHTKAIITNARIPLQEQLSSVEHAGIVFIATFFAAFFTVFFFAMFYSHLFSWNQFI